MGSLANGCMPYGYWTSGRMTATQALLYKFWKVSVGCLQASRVQPRRSKIDQCCGGAGGTSLGFGG